jgi:hypothetical protein
MAYSDPASHPVEEQQSVNVAPWEYIFQPFNSFEFHDLFWPIVAAAIVWLALLTVLYTVRTRRLHGHPPYLDMYEWLLWTGIITFSLVLVYAVFQFDFFFVPITLVIGLGFFGYARFVKFPPIFAAYELKLAKQRYFSATKYAHPESTIRSKSVKRAAGKPVRVAASKRSRKRR